MDVLTLVMVIILSWALARFAILSTKLFKDLIDEYRTITNRLDDIDQEIGILHGRINELNHEIENLKEKKNEY